MMEARVDPELRQLFDEYLRMYAARDDRLTTMFSDDFSGFTGGGDFLVKDREEWVAITRRDFAQVKDAIRIEIKDVAIQSLADTIAVATGFFVIHLPIKDHVLSRQTARLVLIFRKENECWKISHSSISIPYNLVGDGEVYPLKELAARTQVLEDLVAERTLALQRSEERYRSILMASPDDITITDAEGRIVMVSPAAFTVFGSVREEEFLGRPVTDFIVPEDRPRAMTQVALRRQGVDIGASEYRGLRVDGSTFDIEVNSEFMRDADGSPTGMVVIVRDITARKRAEAEKSALEVHLQHAQRLESVSRLAGGVAHEFNNMLGVVLGNVELAISQVAPSQPLHEDLQEIQKAAQRSADLTRQLMACARKQTVQPIILDLNDAVSKQLAMLQRLIGTNVQFAWQPAAILWPVRKDPIQLASVLTNLCLNARDALTDGGTIAIETANCTLDANFCATHPDAVPGDFVRLTVRDTGRGMDAVTLGKIFEPFFTTKAVGEGTGLGLASVFGVMKQNGGFVVVTSVVGRGTTFALYWPRLVESGKAAPRPGATAPDARGHETILLVDDEPAILRFATRALSAQGYAVLAAPSPAEALRLEREHPADIHLLLSDVVMPEMSGRALASAVLALRPQVRQLFTSGHPAEVIASQGMLEPGVAFIEKPYAIAALTSKVREVLDGSRVGT